MYSSLVVVTCYIYQVQCIGFMLFCQVSCPYVWFFLRTEVAIDAHIKSQKHNKTMKARQGIYYPWVVLLHFLRPEANCKASMKTKTHAWEALTSVKCACRRVVSATFPDEGDIAETVGRIVYHPQAHFTLVSDSHARVVDLMVSWQFLHMGLRVSGLDAM